MCPACKRGAFFFLIPYTQATDSLQQRLEPDSAGLCPHFCFPRPLPDPRESSPAEKSVIARGLAFQFCPSPTASVCHQLLDKITGSRCSRQPSVSSPPRRIRAQEKELGLMLNQAVPLRPVHRCPLPSARNPSKWLFLIRFSSASRRKEDKQESGQGGQGWFTLGGPSHSGSACMFPWTQSYTEML